MEAVLKKFVEGAQTILGDNLTGVYLHGSAVMECFNPKVSDLDLIIVVQYQVTPQAKRAIMDMVVSCNEMAPRKGIEMSIVTREVCAPFVYPTPFELHFSVMHLNWYLAAPEDYIAKMNGTDRDLAAHFTVLRQRGRCLCGEPIESVFARVPEEAYMDSILGDIADAKEDIPEDTMYLTLNLARVLAYQRDKEVLSKSEGGRWALCNLPKEYHSLIRDALQEYESGAEVTYDEKCAVNYAEYMLARIAEGCPSLAR